MLSVTETGQLPYLFIACARLHTDVHQDHGHHMTPPYPVQLEQPSGHHLDQQSAVVKSRIHCLSSVKGDDSDDPPLNVFREILQQHQLTRFIKKKPVPTRKISTEKYAGIWQGFPTNIKLVRTEVCLAEQTDHIPEAPEQINIHGDAIVNDVVHDVTKNTHSHFTSPPEQIIVHEDAVNKQRDTVGGDVVQEGFNVYGNTDVAEACEKNTRLVHKLV
jgi:hypothetical protein